MPFFTCKRCRFHAAVKIIIIIEWRLFGGSTAKARIATRIIAGFNAATHAAHIAIFVFTRFTTVQASQSLESRRCAEHRMGQSTYILRYAA
ncbi:hypothetical protein FQZ97_1085250 [compost metagenome]